MHQRAGSVPLIEYRIQHLAGRDEPLERLLGQLGSATIITDFGSPPPNPWRGYRLCLENPPDGHLCVLQDDVIVAQSFKQKVAEAVAERPQDVISLFVGGLRGRTMVDFRQAQIRHERWCPIFFRDIHHCVALVWPKESLESFVEWERTTTIPGLPEHNFSDDAIIGAWARLTKRQIWATVPSLVEHPDDYPSTIGKKSGDRGRRALAFDDQ